MRVNLGQCPCCLTDIAMDVEFDSAGALVAAPRMVSAKLVVTHSDVGEPSDDAKKVLANAYNRDPFHLRATMRRREVKHGES